MYARGCKYSLEKIKRKIDLCLTMRALLPDIFSGWDAKSPAIQNALNYGYIWNANLLKSCDITFSHILFSIMLPLPGFDLLGRKIFIYRMGCFPPEKVKVEDLDKASGMVAEVLAYEEPVIFITGVVVVVDFEGYSLSHLTHRPLSFMKKQAKYFQVYHNRNIMNGIKMNTILYLLNDIICTYRMQGQLVPNPWTLLGLLQPLMLYTIL